VADRIEHFHLPPGPEPGVYRDLRLNRFGHHPRKRERIRARFGFRALICVVGGGGDFRVGRGRVQTVEPGSLFAVRPGPVYDYGPDEGGTWNEYHLCMQGRGLDRWIALGLWPDDGTVHRLASPARARTRWRRLHRVHREVRGRRQLDREMVLIEQLLVDLHYEREDLAERHGMSYSNLRHRSREITGAPPQRYLHELRCRHAQALLADLRLPVAEVGERVGIDDPYSFSRLFKRHVGMSPRDWRKELDEEEG